MRFPYSWCSRFDWVLIFFVHALLLAQAIVKFLLKKAALAGQGAEMEVAIGEASAGFALVADVADRYQ